MTEVMMADRSRIVTGGVDTHKGVHVAAVVDCVGRHLGTESFPTTPEGFAGLADWLTGYGELDAVGVEGTGSWGAGLARFLTGSGVRVVEVSRPDRSSRRLKGKSDSLDALAAALAVLNGTASVTPKSGLGPVEVIRLVFNSRRLAVKHQTATINHIHAVVDTAPVAVRERYRDYTNPRLLACLLASRPGKDFTDPAAAARVVLKDLALRWKVLNDQITDMDRTLDGLTRQTAPGLRALLGVGPHSAAVLLITAGDNPERLGSSASFAALCGTAPVPASSGKNTRGRLSRGGDRHANSALHTIARVRRRHDQRTQTYVAHLQTDQKKPREIMRILKRAIARDVYKAIIQDLERPEA